MPYLPYNPKPKPPPPYVPPAPVMVITAPTAGQTITDNTPTLRGTAPAAGTVTVVIKQGSTTVQTLTPTASAGTWAATAATLPDNVYTVTASQTVSGSPVTSGPVTFTVDTVVTPPSSVVIMSPAAGATVQDDTPPIVGSAPGGGTVTVTVSQGATLLQTLTAAPSGGTWQVTATSLPDGVYQIGASQVGAGNATPVTFTVDVPQPVVVVSSVDNKPSGSSTNDTTPAIVGTAGTRVEDSTTITVQVRQGATVIQTLTPTRSGSAWTTTPTALAVGSYQVRATQASSFGTGTSADFPFSVTAAAVLPQPTISTPTEGQTLAGNPIQFTGTAGTAAGDSTMLTVRVYPAGSSTATASQAVTRSGGGWSLSFTATIPNGSWQARVEQGGTAGVGVSTLRGFTMAIPSAAAGLAMPRGPVNGFAGAADFYDSVGVCHHPNYFAAGDVSNPATDAAIGAMQQLGVRHVRLGLDSPATHGNDWRSQQFLIRERAIRGANQPIHAIWGTPSAPAQRRNQGYEIYTATDTNGTFLRPLDGPPGTVTTQNWTAAEGGGKKYSAGTFYDIGWEGAAALQGPNEPVDGYENGFESVRWISSNLQSAKNARTNETVLSGGSYVDHNTGRIVAGPAKAPQLPMVSASIINATGRWPIWGNYADRQDVDVGAIHNYWGGHSPVYDEEWALTSGSRWGQREGFNGSMATGSIVAGNRFVNPMPMFVTETGYIQRPGSDPGSGQRYVPPDVAGEYLIRTLCINYKSGIVKRTYIFSLHDASEGALTGGGRMGLTGNLSGAYTSNFNQRASFKAVQNLLSIVGFRQPTNPVPITVPVTYTNGPSQSMPSKTIVDRLDPFVLQTVDNEYLIFFPRQSQIWNRDTQAYMTPGARDATATLPSGTWTTSICEPAKNSVGSPENPTSVLQDGQTYANPTDGTAFAAANTAGNGFTQSGNTLVVRTCGYTRVVKAVRSTPTDALHTRVVSELNEFANWTTANSVQGAVTEFGVPTNTDDPTVTDSDVDEWAGLLETYYQRLQATNLFSLQWVASEVSVGELSTYLSPGYGQALNRPMAAAGPLEAHANDPLMYRGIALTGLEFGTSGQSPPFSNTNPGTLHGSYYAASQGSWTYLRSRGVKVARVGFRWERLQPTLGGPLNGTYLQAIRDQVTRANTAGVDVVLDCHNYGGYITSSGQLKLDSAGLTSAHFADLWRRLALEFASNPRVVAYEIMNEPEGMPSGASGWRTISQACVNAIRAVDATTAIWVGGYNWSKVQGWVATNGATPWITGHTGIVYVAHQYFDTESSLNLGGPAADSGYAQPYGSAVADSVTVPPAASSIHVVGDLHFGRSDALTRANQVTNDETPVAARVQVGDFVERSDTPSQDTTANGWANTLGGGTYGVIGNHDIGYPSGATMRTAEQAVTAFSSWTNTTPNWFVDLAFCRMIGVKPEPVNGVGPGGRAMWLSQTTIDWVGARCAETGLNCVIFVHCPLENTVLGNNAVEWTSNPAENPNWALAPAAAINTMLNAHANAKVVVSGHTHSSLNGTVPGIVATKNVGSRNVICVNASAVAFTSRNQTAGPVKTFYLTLTASQLEVRVRDHTSQAWSDFGGTKVTTRSFQGGPGQLSVSGGRIVDPAGSVKLLRGANMMSQEWDNNMTNERVAIPVLASNWNGNIVTKGFASGPVNSGSATYLAHLDEYVSLTAANQLYMAFVYRTPAQNGDPQPELPDAAATQALTALAARYKASPHVIFGLQVEPHGASATWTAMRPLFESMVDSIRGASGSNNANFPLILVPGYDWSRNLSGAIANPVAKPNVVYKTHPYNASSQFQALFGTAHDAGLPVFVGEFAPNVDMSQADVDALLSFTRDRGIGWAAWLFDTRTENLLTSWSGTPSSPYGVSVRNEMLLTP